MKSLNLKLRLMNLIKYKGLLLLLFLILPLTSCQAPEKKLPIVVEEESDDSTDPIKSGDKVNPEDAEYTSQPTDRPVAEDAISSEVFSWINEEGMSLETRINTPAGYARIPSVSEELSGFLRELTLKTDGSEVLLYDGSPKGNQESHVAIFDMDLGDRDLQQCADSIMRIYAEYFWSIGAYDQIAFHLTNGFLMEYTKWRDGNRIVVDGNDVQWTSSAAYDDSYEAFRKYLTMVFAYAGTLSLAKESDSISLDEMKTGDMLLEGGSPGHCLLVVDTAENSKGERCFLLAQGYMPAQDFHIIINPLHPEDPWYYESEFQFPLRTPSWTFEEGSLARWNDFPLNEAGEPLTFGSTVGTNPISITGTDSVPAMAEEAVVLSKEPTRGTPNTKEATTGEVPLNNVSSRVTLLAVGDNLIHSQVIKSGKQEDGTYNYDHLYANLRDEISAADIAIINQETILGGEAFSYSGYPNFNSPTEIGDAVIAAGFDVVLHATNHTMDMGYKGVKNTLEYWEKHPDITVLGINRSLEDSNNIRIVEKNGIRIAMLNYTYSLNGYSVPKDKPYLVNMLDKKKMAADIKEAERLADFTIVFPHWGTEYVYEATKSQKNLTKFFYEQGVDLVIGTHPHVIEPVEWMELEEDHRMLVYYSLGNFMSYQKEAPRMLGGMASITITKDLSGTYISDSAITPLVTHYENGPADYNYAIYKLTDYSENLALLHGVSEIAMNGPLTFDQTYELAIEVLGPWMK